MTDQELLQRYRSGDISAFETLLGRHEGGMLRYAACLTRDRELSRDVVQEAFVALVAAVRRGDSPDSPAAWLFRVVRNRAGDAVKAEVRMRRRHEAVATPEAQPPTPSPVEQLECEDILGQRFAQLADDHREVLVLKIHEGKTYREIAAITGFSLGKIADLIHKGLTQLSRELRAAGVV